MASKRGWIAVGLSVALIGACGGETGSSGDGTGGSGSGAAGSGGSGGGAAASGGSGGGAAGAGGSGGSAGAAGTGGAAGSGGSGGCGPLPGAKDCLGCSGFVLPICKNGSWVCPPLNCSDAGPDGAICNDGHVPTVEGCLSCAQASTKLGELIAAARAKSASCNAESDCVMTGSATACSGSCGVAVSKTGEAAFQAALTKIDTDYCTGYVPVCGYTTPKCAVPTLVCNAGQCEAKY